MHVVYGMFLMFKHLLCWKYQYNQYMFDFINIYSFISVSGCVGMASSALFYMGANNAVKMALKTIRYSLSGAEIKLTNLTVTSHYHKIMNH